MGATQESFRPIRLFHVFSTFSVGGPQIRFTQMIGGFAAEVEHIVLAMDGRYDCFDLLPDDANVSKAGFQPTASFLPFRLGSYRRELAAMRPYCMLTYNWGAIEWAAANCIPLCPHIHIEDGFGPEESDRQIWRRVLLRRLVLSRRSHVIVPSRTLYCLAKDVWRLPETSLRHIPNGIDLAPYGSISMRDARRNFDLPLDKPIVGTLATLRPEKNLVRLIEAFSTLRERYDCHLVIAGAGKEKEKLETRVRELRLEEVVSFPGFVKRPHAILPAFDIFALSSDTEQMPLSVIEAMAAGLPVVSLDVGDVREMVAANGRFLVGGREVESLVGSLILLISDEDLRRSIGDSNAEVARDLYDLTDMVSRYRDLVLKIGE